MSIYTEYVRDPIEWPFERVWEEISPVFESDVAPALKSFLQLFATHEGRLILDTAIKFAPSLITDGFGATTAKVIGILISESIAIAKQDYETTLQQVQSALQVAKVSAGITTATDQAIISDAKAKS